MSMMRVGYGLGCEINEGVDARGHQGAYGVNIGNSKKSTLSNLDISIARGVVSWRAMNPVTLNRALRIPTQQHSSRKAGCARRRVKITDVFQHFRGGSSEETHILVCLRFL